MNPEPAERLADFDEFYTATAKRTVAVAFAVSTWSRTATCSPTPTPPARPPEPTPRHCRKLTQTGCGIELGEALVRGGTTRFEGTSKTHTGVTVWMESEGPYVAVLFVTAPGNPESQSLDTGVEKCIAASLYRLAPDAPAATEHAPPASVNTSGGTGTGKADRTGATADRGDVHSTDSC
ncbi:hypothetical protein [Actinacidiphila paucisporea]|uniref:Beta-lactamase n=1 Tax=Actinacidiphila paucisporea TaxID=310782 RepID=A0A1M7QLB3_9ACTN|nr:hypothetical protein [Actinacidiphila paucisporea]SHN32123.1 hypothetical protein SAMN05216499_13729 [Actinacidiphila paucisporea]